MHSASNPETCENVCEKVGTKALVRAIDSIEAIPLTLTSSTNKNNCGKCLTVERPADLQEELSVNYDMSYFTLYCFP